jgi:hypothetical protein
MRLSLFMAFGAIASSLVLVAVPAHAQSREEMRVPVGQVAELVAAPDAPGARARLAAHFAAVAADYEAQASEHSAMAKRYRQAPTASEGKRPAAPDTAIHCDRLAERATSAASEARALVAVYSGWTSAVQEPASGLKDAPPARPDSSDLLSLTELQRLAESLPTADSHARLARHYLALAARLDGEAREHRGLAAALRAAPGPSDAKRPGAPDTAVHCERLAERVSRMAADARALASSHAQQQGGR